MPDFELFGGTIDGVSDIIVISVVAIAFVCRQFFCCWKWQNLFVRLLPTISTFVAAVVFFILMTQVAEGWEVLGYLILIIYAGIMLGATLVGWIAWAIFCAAHNRTSLNPDGY